MYSVGTLIKLVKQNRNVPNRLGDTLKFTLFEIPDLKDIEGNWLPMQGSAFDNSLAGVVGIPLTTVKGGIYSHHLTITDSRC